jgi:peptidoglycan hydrolase-like protein with peptidoglycan-binding domain
MALFEQLFPPVVSFGARTLVGGERGTDVAVLQTIYNQSLKVMNPPTPIGPPVPVTGVYDQATRQAVRAVQSYFDLPADGVVGPDTYFVFGQGVGPHVTYGGPRYGSRTLSLGVSGGDVTVLQNRLNLFRYSSFLGGPADGVFGPRTAEAVRQFQQDAVANGDTGLAVDGVVGAATGDATWIYTYAGGRGLFVGRNGLDVVFLQLLLQRLGFYSGRIDGFFGAVTRAAVVAFQTAAGIAADGVVGPHTYFALGQRNQVAAPAPMPVPPLVPAPGVEVCCVPLATATSDLHPYGSACLVLNGAEGFESLDVVGNLLPDPASFGSQFGQYAFQATDLRTGTVLTFLMNQLPTAGDWAGSYSPGVVDLRIGTVRVLPTAAGSTTGPFGPVVLSGDLSACRLLPGGADGDGTADAADAPLTQDPTG